MNAMLTTVDNPYDPFTEWEQWLAFDTSHGYNTCGYLAKVSNTTIGLPDNLNDEEIDRAMDEICKLNFDLYRKVYEKS